MTALVLCSSVGNDMIFERMIFLMSESEEYKFTDTLCRCYALLDNTCMYILAECITLAQWCGRMHVRTILHAVRNFVDTFCWMVYTYTHV